MSVELMIRMVAWMKAVAWTAMAEQAAGAWMVAGVGNVGRDGAKKGWNRTGRRMDGRDTKE